VSRCNRAMVRFPQARGELRRAVARSAAREGLLQIARGLRWIITAQSLGVHDTLPSKAQLGGNHITDARYRW